MPNTGTGHVISVGDVLATICLRRVERRGWVDNFQDLSLPGHLLPLTAEGAMFVIMGMGGGQADAAWGQGPDRWDVGLSLTISL